MAPPRDRLEVDANRLKLKLGLRVALPLAALTVLNALDRFNISYAARWMNPELGLTAETYGMGVSAFFLGYLLFQLPHARLLERLGVKAWMFAMLLLWGLVEVGMAAMRTPAEFYAGRFLLGVAEAGFAPGAIAYLSRWSPRRFRALALASSIAVVPLTMVAAGPLSGLMLELANPLGLPPWRWMFVLQGLPDLLIAFAAAWYFVEGPVQARWLSPTEKAWLSAEMARDRDGGETVAAARLGDVLRNGRVWGLALAWFCIMTGAYGLTFWLPQVIHAVAPGRSDLEIGVISALPQAGVAIGLIGNAWRSDQAQERVWHVGAGALLGAAGLALIVPAGAGWPALLTLLAMGLGLGAAQGPFWAIPTSLLEGPAALTAVAVISMAGTAGGVVGPTLIGAVRQHTGSFAIAAGLLAALLAGAAPLLAWIGRAQPAPQPAKDTA